MRIVTMLVLTLSLSISAAIPDYVILKMIKIESSGRNGIVVLDVNGKYSYGVLQIQDDYLKDSRLPYTLEDVRWSPEKSKQVLKAYVSRYSAAAEKKLGRKLTLREKIAIHNGGPMGYKKRAALRYADSVIKKRA